MMYVSTTSRYRPAIDCLQTANLVFACAGAALTLGITGLALIDAAASSSTLGSAADAVGNAATSVADGVSNAASYAYNSVASVFTSSELEPKPEIVTISKAEFDALVAAYVRQHGGTHPATPTTGNGADTAPLNTTAAAAPGGMVWVDKPPPQATDAA